MGVTVDGSNDNNLISGGKQLTFLFPRDKPAVLMQITLSEFDEGDRVLLEYSNDEWATTTVRKRDVGGEIGRASCRERV